MNISLAFLRTLFFILSIFFMTTYIISIPGGDDTIKAFVGMGAGVLFGLLLIGFDLFFKRFNLRSFNIAVIGIFIGYLMGQALCLIFDAVVDISSISITIQPHALEIIRIILFLFGVYLGTIMTMRAADELYVSIPFVKFAPTAEKKKDLLLDSSALTDPRLLDLASTGILDHHVLIPRFIVKELYAQVEIGDEMAKSRARKALESIKKLESMSDLNVRYNDTDFPEVKEMSGKLTRLARLLDASILTGDASRLQMSFVEGIRFINIHSLSNALKPLMQAGEFIKIKIQRYGKEPRQGVGYLDDGTMVVVNGGGDYISELIDAKVISVKHTSSGRIVFCNAVDDEGLSDEFEDEEDEERP